MLEGRLARWSPMSGVVFVVLFVVAAVLFDDEPAPDASDSAILVYYADDGNQLKLEIAFFLATIAGVFFIWFAGTLSARLRAAEGEPGLLARITVISGAAFVAVMVVASAVSQFVSDALDDNPDVFEVDPQIARLLTNGAYSLNPEAALPLAAPLVLAASLAFLRGRLLPRWLGWAGLVVALGCLLGFLGVTTGLFLLWVIVVAVYLTRRMEEKRSLAIRAGGLELMVAVLPPTSSFGDGCTCAAGEF